MLRDVCRGRLMHLARAPRFGDISGLHSAEGRLVRKGLVFGSEAVLQSDERDLEALRAEEILLFRDLRSDIERDPSSNRWRTAQKLWPASPFPESCQGAWHRPESCAQSR